MTDPHPYPDPAPAGTQVCPHLGLEEDRQTCLGYPSPWNLCHKCSPASQVRLGYQRRLCLSTGFMDCQVYRQPEEEA